VYVAQLGTAAVMTDRRGEPGGVPRLHGLSQPTAKRGLRPQMEDQGAAYQTEADPWRSERNQHSRSQEQ